MTKQEIESFINAVETLKKSFENYEDFSIEVTPDEWHPGEGNFHVKLVYGDIGDLFITCGYRYAYNMQRLFKNDVITAIMG